MPEKMFGQVGVKVTESMTNNWSVAPALMTSARPSASALPKLPVICTLPVNDGAFTVGLT